MQFQSLDAVVVLVTILTILAALLPVEWQYPLVYQRDNFHWYQLFTTNFFHENTRHLLLNLVGLIFMGLLARRFISGLQFAVILIFGLLGAVLAEHVLGQPPYMSITVAETRGLSGALHGLLAASMLYLAVARDRLALIVLCGLLLKVCVEAFRGETLVSSGSVELVAVMGHLGGTISGLALAAALVRSRTVRSN
ncbi:MAG: rhomboid family intramembrane serine protease [Luminiphilus sp.]|jgi:membrane associated rhomboid family serine protease|tara:strand:- start:164 stop:748 length:585 start_codon:yes stop_codon:yes gene_type:complete